MKNTLFEDKDYQLWVLLRQARDEVLRVRQKELSPYGISPQEAAILFFIQVIGNNCTPTDIAQWLLRRHHAVLGILSRMEKKQLISRTRDLKRKNLVRVSLTEKGQQAFYQSTKIDSLHQIMSSLSQEERQQLRSFLEIIRDRALKEVNSIPEPDPKPPFP